MIKKVGVLLIILLTASTSLASKASNASKASIANRASKASKASLETNMTGWRGVEANWVVTQDGLEDDPDVDYYDYAVADEGASKDRNFTYRVTFEKTEGYGVGIMLGIKDTTSREGIDKQYVYFMVDPDNVYYNVFVDGANSETPHGRALTEKELEYKTYELTAVYDKELNEVTFALNGTAITSFLNPGDMISGGVGIVAHSSRVKVTNATLIQQEQGQGEQQEESKGFSTNISGWEGLTSQWSVLNKGFVDGAEADEYDYAVSDAYVSSDTSFTYEAVMERISGYGFGIVMGIPENSSKDDDIKSQSTYFMVDDRNVVYNIHGKETAGRELEEHEKCPVVEDITAQPLEYTIRIEYDAETGMLEYSINGGIVETFYAEEYVTGYLGLIAHSGRVAVKEANFSTYVPAPATETPAASGTVPAAVTPEPDRNDKADSSDSKRGIGSGSIIVIVGVIVIALCTAAALYVYKRRKRKDKS